MTLIDELRQRGTLSSGADVIIRGNELVALIDYVMSLSTSGGSGDIKSDGSIPFTGQEDFQAGLKTDTISPSGTSGVSFAAMIGAKVYTNAEEAGLVPAEGFFYYNSDLDAFRAYDGTAW